VHVAAVMLLIYFFVDIEHIAVVRFKNQSYLKYKHSFFISSNKAAKKAELFEAASER
jgi:hypothetical protein